jgi:Arc/MetJ family transcription regulator
MRVLLDLDEELVDDAKRLTGMKETAAVVNEALKALVARESGRRLARLGGTMPQFVAGRRRRSSTRKASR